jgi:hypothetical protein
MQGQDRARKQQGRAERPGEGRRPGLPAWESFPLEDRHRLVRTILQAARRQVEVQPTSSHPGR